MLHYVISKKSFLFSAPQRASSHRKKKKLHNRIVSYHLCCSPHLYSLLHSSVCSLYTPLIFFSPSFCTEINLIIPWLQPPTQTTFPSPTGGWLRGWYEFSFRLRRLNNLCIIMCKKTGNSSNWHLIFLSSPPLTELNLNNLNSRAHTPIDKCFSRKRAGGRVIWEKMTHIHCQTHIQALMDT